MVGLGNPGAHYAGHRHNVGAQVLDTLAADLKVSFKAHKARAAVAETFLRPGGPRVVLAKPHTYMNLSGGPVANLCCCVRKDCLVAQVWVRHWPTWATGFAKPA